MATGVDHPHPRLRPLPCAGEVGPTTPPYETGEVAWSGIHGTANIARYLGWTRSEVTWALQRGQLRTYEVAGRTCATAEEIDRFYRAELGLDRWENEGGPAR